MTLIKADELCNELNQYGYSTYIGVPCSILKPVINYIIQSNDLTYIAATSEGEAVGIGSGLVLGGKKVVIMSQNSGLGNMVNPLTSLNNLYKIPILLIISWRGEPGKKDAPEHDIMGQITPGLLSFMGIYYEIMSEDLSEMKEQLSRLECVLKDTKKPVALILREKTIEPFTASCVQKEEPELTRQEAIKAVVEVLTGDEKIISTTGKISRELFLEHDSSNNFYMVGSMGCAAPIALGYSLSHPEKPVIVLDGDGAALMKLGALATIGHYGLGNLIHIILDNNAYESTGGQHSISDTVDFVGVAKAIGYKNAVKVWNRNQIINAVKASRVSYGPSMIVIRVSNTSLDNLPRIKYSCEEITERFEG